MAEIKCLNCGIIDPVGAISKKIETWGGEGGREVYFCDICENTHLGYATKNDITGRGIEGGEEKKAQAYIANTIRKDINSALNEILMAVSHAAYMRETNAH